MEMLWLPPRTKREMPAMTFRVPLSRAADTFLYISRSRFLYLLSRDVIGSFLARG
jgi:hypothetical protein